MKELTLFASRRLAYLLLNILAAINRVASDWTKMSGISNIQQNQTEKAEKAASSSAAKATGKEDLVEEFSKLLECITREISNQTQEFVMAVGSAPAASKTKARGQMKKEPSASKEVNKESELTKAVEVAAKSDIDNHTVVVKSESPKEKEEVSSAPKEEKKSTEDAETKECDSGEEKVEDRPPTALSEKPEEELQATAEPGASDVPAETADPTQQQVAVAAVQVKAAEQEKKAEDKEVSSETESAEEQPRDEEVASTSHQMAHAKSVEEAPEEQSGKQDANGQTPSDPAQPHEQKASKTKSSGEAMAQQVTVTETIAPEVEAAKKALEKALQAAGSEKEQAPAATGTAAASSQNSAVLQSLDPKSKPATAASQQALTQLMKEVTPVTPSQPGNGMTHNFTLTGLANVKSHEHSGAESSKAMPKLSHSAQQRAIAKIEETLKEVSKSADGKTVSLRLDPPELGSVKIEVTYKDSTLSAKLIADNPAVTSTIREKAFELQSMLRKLGLNVERIVVQVSQEQFSGQEAGGQSFTTNTGSQEREHQSSSGPALNELFRDLQERSTIHEAVKSDDHWVA